MTRSQTGIQVARCGLLRADPAQGIRGYEKNNEGDGQPDADLQRREHPGRLGRVPVLDEEEQPGKQADYDSRQQDQDDGFH